MTHDDDDDDNDDNNGEDDDDLIYPQTSAGQLSFAFLSSPIKLYIIWVIALGLVEIIPALHHSTHSSNRTPKHCH